MVRGIEDMRMNDIGNEVREKGGEVVCIKVGGENVKEVWRWVNCEW